MENRYLIPALVLASMLVALASIARFSFNSMQSSAGSLRDQQDEISTFQSRAIAETAILSRQKEAAAPAKEFLNQWRPHQRDSSLLLSDFSRLGNDTNISVQSRKSGNMDYPWRGKTQNAQYAEGMGVSNEYFRLLNWLGSIEAAWPLIRFETVRLELVNSSLRLSLRTAYPSFIVEEAK